MSQSEPIAITCPVCTNRQTCVVWQSINVTLDPELKQRLLDRSLFAFRCDQCGHTAGIEQELMYHDMERKLMILRAKEEPKESLAEVLT